MKKNNKNASGKGLGDQEFKEILQLAFASTSFNFQNLTTLRLILHRFLKFHFFETNETFVIKSWDFLSAETTENVKNAITRINPKTLQNIELGFCGFGLFNGVFFNFAF